MYKSGTSKYIRQSEKKKEASGILLAIAYFLLFLMAMDFKAKIFYCAIGVFVLVVFMRFEKFEIPLETLPVFILTVSLIVFSSNPYQDITLYTQPLVYTMCFLTGYNLSDAGSVGKSKQRILFLFLTIAAGAYCHYILNMIINLGKTNDRNTIDFWTQSVYSATGQSLMGAMMMGVATAVLFSSASGVKKLLAFGILLSILYYNLILGGRTLLILFASLVVINLLTSWSARKDIRKLIRSVIVLFLVIIIAVIMIRKNVFGIMDVIGKSNFYQRFFTKFGATDLNEDGRMRYKLLYIKHLADYPFGKDGLLRLIGYYAHDIILDTYSMAGVFACLAVICMLVNTVIKSIRLIQNTSVDRDMKSLALNVMLSIFIAFAMEPILQAAPWLFASYCVLYGALKRLTELPAEELTTNPPLLQERKKVLK